jgi:predicted transcriptional regulator
MKGNLLGSLESQIMEFFWQSDRSAAIASLHAHLSKKDQLAYTTVATVVMRLTAKGLLRREKAANGFIYRARQNREEFLRFRSRSVIKMLLGDFGDLAVAGFVDELKNNPKALEKLRELSHE